MASTIEKTAAREPMPRPSSSTTVNVKAGAWRIWRRANRMSAQMDSKVGRCQMFLLLRSVRALLPIALRDRNQLIEGSLSGITLLGVRKPSEYLSILQGRIQRTSFHLQHVVGPL